MNSNPGTPGDAAGASSTFKPYVADDSQMTESTIGAIVLGSILGIVFAAASVYAGLKVGLTTSASIPIGVLSITILKAFGKSTILKNNIVQTTGSAGESLAAGVAFTLPSLLLMGFDMDVLRITLIALLGGILGTLMMIPLRQSLIVKEHGKLPYPEGTACAQVLIVGEKGGSSAKSLFGGLFLGGAWAYLGRIGRLFGEEPTWLLDKIPWGKTADGAARMFPFFKGGSFSFETNPVLLGTGYIIGWRTSFIMLAGGILSYLVLIPAVKFFGADMTSPLIVDKTTRALIKAGDMSPGQIRNAFVLYIGAGAVAAGGLISLAKALPTIVGAFVRGLSGLTGGGGATVRRTERDLPMGVVVLGCIALVFAIWAPNLAFTQGLISRDILGINWLSAILIVVFGFFFVTVSSRITGEIGSSSNPISGMTVATLLITCILFVAVGRTGISYKEMALCTAALVCVAASNGGATSQALKCGHLLGATPRKQQIAITWGVITSAAVIGFTLMFLNDNFTTYHKFDARGFAATQATLDTNKAAGNPDDLAVVKAKVKFRDQTWDELYVRKTQMDPAAPDKVLVPVGQYLIAADGTIAFRIDPGICGTEKDQIAADGRTVERHIEKKFDAPKAQLFRLVIDGVLGGNLPWELVLIGVFIAIMMELCGVPALAFAVGVYLPVSTSSSIFLGGLIRKLADKKSKLTEAEQESSPGVLCSSGMIAGGALVAILSCALLAPKQVTRELPVLDDAGKPVVAADGTPKTAPGKVDTTWGDDFDLFTKEPLDLNLAHKLAGENETVGQVLARHGIAADSKLLSFCDDSSLHMNARAFLDEHNWWGLGSFCLLGLLLYVVAARKKRPEPAATDGAGGGPI